MQENQEIIDQTTDSPEQLFYVYASRIEIVKVVLLGLVVGVVVPILGWLISEYFIKPVFCTNSATGGKMDICVSGAAIAGHTSALIAGLGAFILLTRWNIYRALLLVLASTVVMWIFAKYSSPVLAGSWFEYLALSAVLYTLCFFSFFWILRIRSFPFSLIALLITITGACYVMAI